MKKSREIALERDEVVVIRRRTWSSEAWCDRCGDLVRMITPDEAMAVAGQTARQIYRAVEAGRLHFLESREGFLSICLRSLY